MKSNEKFVSVLTHSNWCEYDCYGTPKVGDDSRTEPTNLVHNKDNVMVKWPDGTIEKATIKVIESSMEVSDMGNPWTVPIRTAYIKARVHGVLVLVPLRQHKNIKIRKLG